MKIAAAQAERFSQQDQPAFHAVLFYGPDEGRVRERVKALARSVTGGVDDPFQSSVINPAQLDESPSLLTDEALQLSLMGGRRAVTLEGAADTHVAQIKTLLTEALPLPTLVILQAGELTPRSKLRTLFDKEKTLACVATYVDDQRSLSDTIRDWSRAANRQISREAEALLVQSLGGDRALTRQELEKLDLYMVNEPAARVEVADVQACLAGLTTIDQDDALFAALAGDSNNALRHLGDALEQGRAPEALVATYLYHLTRLSDGHAAMGQGQNQQMNAREAVEKMRPPVFFQKKGAVTAQLQKLSRGNLLQNLYLGALELQKNVRTQRDQGPMYLERFLLSVASRSR